MPRVICDLPNASDEISGVKFHPLEEGGLISDEISQEQAEYFAGIAGYAIDEDEREPKQPEAVVPAPTTRKASKRGATTTAAETPPAAPEGDAPAAGSNAPVF